MQGSFLPHSPHECELYEKSCQQPTLGSVLVFCFHGKNYHNVSDLKQRHFKKIFYSLYYSGIWTFGFSRAHKGCD